LDVVGIRLGVGVEARQGLEGRAGEGKAERESVADSRGAVRGNGIRDQDRDSIWKEIEEEIADVSCFWTC
jgi:hypothetical protein